MEELKGAEACISCDPGTDTNDVKRNHYSVVLLRSVVLFVLLVPILEGNPTGELVLAASMVAVLIFATLDLSAIVEFASGGATPALNGAKGLLFLPVNFDHCLT